MQIFLSKLCNSLTGALSRSHGYSIKHRKNGFFGVRNPKNVPENGHWRFILDFAQMTQGGFLVSDIEVSGAELYDALYEAHHFIAARQVKANAKKSYNARDIINLKTTYSL